MKQIAILLLILTALLVSFIYVGNPSQPRSKLIRVDPEPAEQGILVKMLCSDEKADWVRRAASEFSEHRPDVRLRVDVMSTMEGMEAILAGEQSPTVWSPVDTTILHYISYRWSEENGEPLFTTQGEDAPKSLARSPVVWLSWKSRIAALDTAMATGTMAPGNEWVEMGCAGIPKQEELLVDPAANRWDLLVPMQSVKTLDSFRDMNTWGQVKFSYTDPTETNAGLQTIYMMAYGFLGIAQGMDTSMVEDTEFLTWFRRCQRSKAAFPVSTRKLTKDVMQLGPTRFDFVVTYENLALKQVMGTQSRWSEQPYIYYPKKTTLSDHPIVLLQGEELTRDQIEAARDWIAFLLTPERQQELIQFGLRPVRQDVAIQKVDENNPFREAVQYNAQVDFQSEIMLPPSGAVIHSLLTEWRQATGLY